MGMTNLTAACEGCPGRCCTRRFWSNVHLTRNESRNPVFKGHLTFNRSGELVLALGRRACPFLAKSGGGCTIYEDRPMACRSYVCHTAGGHSSEVIESFPALQRHLKRKGIRWAPRNASHYYVTGVPGYQRFLRDIRGMRGTREKDVFRYNVKTDTYALAGRFDRRGKFHRNHVRK